MALIPQLQQKPQAPGQGLFGSGDVMGYIRSLINQGGQGPGGGAFGPTFLRDLLRKRAMQRAGNRRRRGDVLGGLVGLDPQQQRFQMLQDERESSGQLAGALNDADVQGGLGYQGFLQSLLGNERGTESNLFAAREADARAKKNQGGFGGFLGQVAGAALPGVGNLLPKKKARVGEAPNTARDYGNLGG